MGGLGDFVKGAGGGALAGGSFGWGGALAGGLIGGIGGLMGSNPEAEAAAAREKYLKGINSRIAPQLGPADNADYSGFRGNQQQLVSQLEAMARGEGPSVSREMLNEATNRNVASQNAIAAGGRGGNLGAMVAANNTGRLGAQAAQDAALGRVQEQNAAINNLGMQLYSARGADEDMNRFNAGQNNQFALNNAQNRLQFWANQDSANLGGINGMRGGPSTGDQILAGGSAMRSYVDSNRANNNGVA